jgi:hypothetical protein
MLTTAVMSSTQAFAEYVSVGEVSRAIREVPGELWDVATRNPLAVGALAAVALVIAAIVMRSASP